jgi:hypothetical protein
LDDRLYPDPLSECGSRRSKRAKREGKNGFKRQIIRNKTDLNKYNIIGIKWVNVTLFSLKLNF